jgi:hypothetical protein
MKNTKKYFLLLIAVVSVHLFFLSKLLFTAWPEMLLWPYLWLHGILPYKDVAIVHTPLLLMKLSVWYGLFGVGITQLKIFTWILIIFTDILVFWVSKKLWNQKTALIILSTFAFWQIFFDGNGLWFDLLLAPLAVLTFYFVSRKKYIWAGIFWAIAFFTKQTAVFFLIPIGYVLVKNSRLKIQNYKNFTFGALSVVAIFAIILGSFGILPDFYKWAINFGIFVLPRAQGQIQLPGIRNFLIAASPFAIFIPFLYKKQTRNINILLWAIAGCLGAYPRFEYFHFQPAIPFLAMSAGTTIMEVKDWPVKVFIYIYILGGLLLFTNYLVRNYDKGTRFYEQDVTDVSSYVKSNTKPGDKIFVMNWWDNIYALTGTMPATDPWVPQLSWYQEVSGIQEKEVANLEASRPAIIVLQDYSEAGLASYKPQIIYNYVMANYKFKEKVDDIEILISR